MEHNVNFPDGEGIKAHFRRNKKLYLGIGIGVAITLAIRKPVVINIAPVFNNSNQQVNFAGHTTKLVKCLETGQVWEKVTESAKSAGVPLARMSRHLHGHNPHLNGLHYKIVGVGTTG
jgi:hypothetical protein